MDCLRRIRWHADNTVSIGSKDHNESLNLRMTRGGRDLTIC